MYNAEQNSLVEISATAAVLGAAGGLCVCSLVSAGGSAQLLRLAVYGLLLATYYMLEFIQTARFQPSKVNSRLFLIYGRNGSREFLAIQLLNIWEHLFTRSRFNFLYASANSTKWLCLGLAMAIAGQTLRYLAMQTCGESFSHVIETTVDPAKPRKLAQTGVYSLSRHPSYLGFWFFVVGVEMLLQNWIALVLSVLALRWFFQKRVEFEEWFLINRMYGDEYVQYKARVGAWIPLVFL